MKQAVDEWVDARSKLINALKGSEMLEKKGKDFVVKQPNPLDQLWTDLAKAEGQLLSVSKETFNENG